MRPLLPLLTLLIIVRAALADPATWQSEGWKTDFSKTGVEFSQIMSGGPPKDGIPAIDSPLFTPLADVKDISSMEPVIGLEVAGEAKAYPLRVLMWHEIANDTIGGVPVAVTYCPLCNASLVFDRRLDGTVLDFGTTGKLRNSDLVMYDRQTESWWQQFTGEAIVGALQGKSLLLVPSRLESFAEFAARFPKGLVLVPNNDAARSYGANPYVGYDSLARPFLYDGSLPDGIDPMARVVVVRDGGKPKLAMSMEAVRKAGSIERDGYRITWQTGQASALDAAAIAKGRNVGSIVVTRQGKDVVYDVTFAFVAHAFHPEVKIEQ